MFGKEVKIQVPQIFLVTTRPLRNLVLRQKLWNKKL